MERFGDMVIMETITKISDEKIKISEVRERSLKKENLLKQKEFLLKQLAVIEKYLKEFN
jgi:hypothetical protein